jgi:hypothetical protein
MVHNKNENPYNLKCKCTFDNRRRCFETSRAVSDTLDDPYFSINRVFDERVEVIQ